MAQKHKCKLDLTHQNMANECGQLMLILWTLARKCWAATSQFELNPMFGSLSDVGPNQLMHQGI